jgi:protein involved in polysaccharide export with SLBB domain
MNVKPRILLLCFFILLSLFGSAQVSLSSQNISSINVDDLSDSDIKAYYQKAVDNGLSDDAVYTMLAQKGMPSDEIDKLKDRVEKIRLDNNSATSTPTVKDDSGSTNIKPKYDRDSNKDAYYSRMRPVKSDLTVFGSELFASTSSVFEPNLRIPTPAGYILGPDDELVINVFGFSERTYTVTVSAEGNIYIPQVGPLFVNGLSIEQASSRIKTKLASTIYKAIKTGQTSVQISLGKIRSIRVTVIGESKKPGTYTVSSLTTLFNLLYLCGGPSDMGSYRNIELIRGNEIKRTVDLYAFLLKGDQKDNVLLQEGDVIRIPYYTTRVIINGNIKHIGKYEMVPGETFQNLLNFCGGFADNAYKAAVTVYQLTEKDRQITDLSKSDYNSYKPQGSDSIVVGKLLDRFENRITIKGAIMRPGEYQLNDNTSLKELIEKAGGVKEDVYTKRGIISRYNVDRTPLQLSFDVDSVLNGEVHVSLKRDDSVTVYSIFDLQNEKTVSIDGQVKKPGTYKWVEDMTVKGLLLTAGGLNEFADSRNIEIARVIKNADITKPNYVQTQIIDIDASDSSSQDIVLKPSDVVIVKQQAGYGKQRSVYVDGMVISPGRYILNRSGDRIDDLLKRVGGFAANADSTTIVIRRVSAKTKATEERDKTFSKLLNIRKDSLLSNERLRSELDKDYDKISINLTAALMNPASTDNMLLEDGDVITVDRNTSLVKVSGEVYFPTIIPYEPGASVKYYIQKSGSFTPLARKSSIMVIYGDGRASKVKHFLFFKKYPIVTSRSEILVPQKPDNNRQRISTADWALIVSALGVLASVIYTFKK